MKIETMEWKEMFNKDKNILFVSLTVALAILLVFNVVQISGFSKLLEQKAVERKELARPAQLEVITLLATGCTQCYSMKKELEQITKQNVKIQDQKTIDFQSIEGKSLVEKYGIKKLPTFIIRGETVKNNQLENFWKKTGGEVTDENEVILQSTAAPYFDIELNKTIGVVNMIQLSARDCNQCTSISKVIDALKQNGVVFGSDETIDYSEPRSVEIIQKHGVQQVPALLFSKEIEAYPSIFQQLKQLTTQEKEGYYALHSTSPPYLNAATGKTIGLVELILLKDSNCTECYDVALNKTILTRFGVVVSDEIVLEASSPEGKVLINQYQIEKIPIILMSPDANVYPLLNNAWPSVGSVETNGWFIMRSPEVLGTYRVLSTGQIVNPTIPPNSTVGGGESGS